MELCWEMGRRGRKQQLSKQAGEKSRKPRIYRIPVVFCMGVRKQQRDFSTQDFDRQC